MSRFCGATWTVDSTQRQYWFCERPDGHDGPHAAFWPTGAVRATSSLAEPNESGVDSARATQHH